jgi:hypothetical protein
MLSENSTNDLISAGISYIESSKAYQDQPQQFTNWEATSTVRAHHKVPTMIAYPKDEGSGLSIIWGFEAWNQGPTSDNYIRYANFKLWLPIPDGSGYDSDDGMVWGPEGGSRGGKSRSAEEVTRDFLDLLFEHFEKIVKNQWGYSRSNYDYHILFTVPATFSPATVKRFEEIVRNTRIVSDGGSESIHFEVGSYREPEAAGIHTIFELPSHHRKQLHIGDSFVVCDAGGGTVVSVPLVNAFCLQNTTFEHEQTDRLACFTILGRLLIYRKRCIKFSLQIRSDCKCERY